LEFRNKFALSQLLLFLAVFTLFRIVLYFLYSDYFSDLTTIQILSSFIDGLRFDLSIILTFAGLPLFLLNLPVKSKLWLKIWAVIVTIIFIAMLLILVGDVFYFDVVKRHLGDDLLLALDDADFVWSFAINQYWYVLIAFIITFTWYFRFLFKRINRNFENTKTKIAKEIITQLVIILLVIIGIRGSFGDKPINVINAFGQGSSAYGNLTLNGVFSVYHVSRSAGKIKHDFYAKDKAYNNAISLIIEQNDYLPDKNYPLMRKFKNFSLEQSAQNKLNIVFFLLESWTPQYIDCYSHKEYRVTPNFDTIAQNGLKFTNCFANGDRSIYGITATLLGIPQPIGLPYLGTGLELYNIFRIGKILDELGYRTIFTQTSSRGSYRVDAIAKGLGFKEYYAQQDFPKKNIYETDEIPHFGWDYEGLMFLEKKISEQNKPFFAYLFTGTTHEEYVLASKRFEKYPHQRNGINGFLNTLYYSDWAFGEFFKIAKTKPWFKHTIFIFTADHCNRYTGKTIPDKFLIPLVIYAPGIIEPAESNVLASQSDLPATIFDLLKVDKEYSGTGKSLLQNYKNRFVLGRRGETMFYVNENGIVQHNLDIILEHQLFYKTSNDNEQEKTINNIKKDILSIDQFLYTLIKSNRFYK
jgi:phosphoglycerol transferase MdoB-like AlkP superfamily enzyme